MGSPMLAYFFMRQHKRFWLKNYTGRKVIYFRTYVDDITCCSKNCKEYLNACYVNVKFTMEKVEKVQLLFLPPFVHVTKATWTRGICWISV